MPCPNFAMNKRTLQLICSILTRGLESYISDKLFTTSAYTAAVLIGHTFVSQIAVRYDFVGPSALVQLQLEKMKEMEVSFTGRWGNTKKQKTPLWTHDLLLPHVTRPLKSKFAIQPQSCLHTFIRIC